MYRRLTDRLAEYAQRNLAPFHMPGHKRTAGIYDYIESISSLYDITEVEGFDNLHGANGILKEAMDHAAAIYDSKRTFFSVNGSSAGILAGIRAAATRGGHIIVARNCHKSVYNAIELCGLTPHFAMPQYDSTFNLYGSIAPADIAALTEQYPQTQLIVITSPTYDGIISDVKAICDEAHKHNIPVLIDEAHGAHLGFLDRRIANAVACGADIVIQSTHKTLPSLTQTALIHINGTLVEPAECEWQLSVFETTSPSYLLLASIDGCMDYLARCGEEAFAAWRRNLVLFEELTKDLKHLRILHYGRDAVRDYPSIYRFDKSKIVVSTDGTDLDGVALEQCLLGEFGIEPEMYLASCVTLMTGMGTTEEHIRRLAAALNAIDARCKVSKTNPSPFILKEMPVQVVGAEEARLAPHEAVALTEAAGRIIARYLWAYPPGAPFLIPGEVIRDDLIAAIEDVGKRGTILKHNGRNFDGNVLVLKNK